MLRRLFATRRRTIVTVALCVGAVALTGLAIFVMARDLDAAVKWASVISAFVALAGLAVTIVAARKEPGHAGPGPHIAIDKKSGHVAGEDTVVEAGNMHSGTLRIKHEVGDITRNGSSTAARLGDIGGPTTARKDSDGANGG